jgi:L-ascorbate metabolism protein UlaG (beta-lactamase superfamily)
LDAETLIPILKNNPGISFIIPEANRAFVAARVGCPESFPVGLDAGQNIHIGPFTFYGIPAKHNEIEHDEEGRCRYLGYVIRFGAHTIYHSGDTLWFDDLVDTLRPFQPELLLLPINGNDAARLVAGNLDSREAVKLGKALGSTCVIPCHYDMFTFNTADVSEFIREAQLKAQAYTVLKGGECFSN